MKTRGCQMADGGSQTRSVLDCGSPLPLSHRVAAPSQNQNAKGLAQIKTWRNFPVLLVFIILPFACCLQVRAQTYSIDWFTIDGGGGTSTGGPMIGINYSVSGTIGQSGAGGPMTNGQYSVTGGFWALPAAVQVTGTPTLTIIPATPGNATISWMPNTPGFVLQETLSPSPTNWTNSPSGSTNPIVVSTVVPAKFYRLFKP